MVVFDCVLSPVELGLLVRNLEKINELCSDEQVRVLVAQCFRHLRMDKVGRDFVVARLNG